jgi:hypothetical protein
MKPYQIEIYNQVFDLSPSKVLANSIRGVFGPIEKKWHDRIFNDFYKIFENLDDVYENANGLAQDALSETVNAALGILAKNSIYDIDEKNFLEEYLSKYEFWDDYFYLIASQYEAIIEETAQKDAYRTQRRLNRSKLVGFGSAPSLDNGYRSAQSYANFSNTVDNLGHGIFNLMAKGVTAIGNSIKKDEIFKSQATLEAVDSAVCSIISASRDALIDALNVRGDGAIHIYSNEEIKRANAIWSNVESGRVPESDIQKQILSLFLIYPYDERIYTFLLTNFGANDGRLDVVAEFFGISALTGEKEKLFRSKLNDVDLSSVAAIRSNLKLLSEFARNIGYSNYAKDLKGLLDAAREKEFQQEVAKYQFQTNLECDDNLAKLGIFAKQMGYTRFAEWSAEVRVQLDKRQRTFDGVEYASRFNADYAQKTSEKLRDTLGKRSVLFIHECKYNKGHVIRVAKNVLESTRGMKLIRMDEESGTVEGKSSVSLTSWGESFTIQVGGENDAKSAILVIKSSSRSSFAGSNKNEELVNTLTEKILMALNT